MFTALFFGIEKNSNYDFLVKGNCLLNAKKRFCWNNQEKYDKVK